MESEKPPQRQRQRQGKGQLLLLSDLEQSTVTSGTNRNQQASIDRCGRVHRSYALCCGVHSGAPCRLLRCGLVPQASSNCVRVGRRCRSGNESGNVSIRYHRCIQWLRFLLRVSALLSALSLVRCACSVCFPATGPADEPSEPCTEGISQRTAWCHQRRRSTDNGLCASCVGSPLVVCSVWPLARAVVRQEISFVDLSCFLRRPEESSSKEHRADVRVCRQCVCVPCCRARRFGSVCLPASCPFRRRSSLCGGSNRNLSPVGQQTKEKRTRHRGRGGRGGRRQRGTTRGGWVAHRLIRARVLHCSQICTVPLRPKCALAEALTVLPPVLPTTPRTHRLSSTSSLPSLCPPPCAAVAWAPAPVRVCTSP
jgi:hypothetical protein